MTQYGVPLAVECNIFSLWLAQYPFGGDPYSHHINAEELRLAAKQKTIERIALGRAGCPAMGAIIKTIMHSDEGRAKMVEYELIGLLGAAFHDTNHDGGKDEYAEIWYEVHGVNTAPDIGLGPMMRRNPRAHDESFEEQTLRRRRREAMVLGEMGRPIEREDIIQRVVT